MRDMIAQRLVRLAASLRGGFEGDHDIAEHTASMRPAAAGEGQHIGRLVDAAPCALSVGDERIVAEHEADFGAVRESDAALR